MANFFSFHAKDFVTALLTGLPFALIPVFVALAMKRNRRKAAENAENENKARKFGVGFVLSLIMKFVLLFILLFAAMYIFVLAYIGGPAYVLTETKSMATSFLVDFSSKFQTNDRPDVLSGNSWRAANDDSLLVLSKDNTFHWYQDADARDDNYYCLVLENEGCIVNGENTMQSPVTSPYWGFYFKANGMEALDFAGMNTGSYISFIQEK